MPLSSDDTEPADYINDFLDPLTGRMIVDPVIASNGFTYDRCCTATCQAEHN